METAGVEPASKDPAIDTSTCVVQLLSFHVTSENGHPNVTLARLISYEQTPGGSVRRILLKLNLYIKHIGDA